MAVEPAAAVLPFRRHDRSDDALGDRDGGGNDARNETGLIAGAALLLSVRERDGSGGRRSIRTSRSGWSCRSRPAARPTCSPRARGRPGRAARPAGGDRQQGRAPAATVGTDIVAKSKPDGYTLLFGTAATHGINVSLYQRPAEYDPVKDFELVALTGTVPMVLLVPPEQPHTLTELIAKLKAEPGKWSYASSGNGTTNHLAGELFKTPHRRRRGARALSRLGSGAAGPDGRPGRLHVQLLRHVARADQGRQALRARRHGRQAQRRAARRADLGGGRPAGLHGRHLERASRRRPARPGRSSTG